MPSKKIVIIGAGVGGLAAAALLAKRGEDVLVVEARDRPGGLASRLRVDTLNFDLGPYILLDRAGLAWVYGQLGESLSALLHLRRLHDVYQVEPEDGPIVRIHGDLDTTAAGIEQLYPGSGERYVRFVRRMYGIYQRLLPLQFTANPDPRALLRYGALDLTPFLLRPLSAVLHDSGLPPAIVRTLAIWTQIAGQKTREAPSLLAFVPALIHYDGAYVCEDGIARVPETLETLARSAGAEFRYGVPVREIICTGDQVRAVRTDDETIAAAAIISNASPISTYTNLLRQPASRYLRGLQRLPLQSPGVGAYLAVEQARAAPLLRFRLPRRGLCRLLIQPGAADPQRAGTARLLGPMEQEWARQLGPAGQQAYLDKLLTEPWWRADFAAVRVVDRRVAADLGRDYSLYHDSMNPVMTTRLMLNGRVGHTSRRVKGLFFAGSATHPGQWVSFAAISGILAARQVPC